MGNRKQPFGYRVVMGEIALHPQESKLVEYIFQLDESEIQWYNSNKLEYIEHNKLQSTNPLKERRYQRCPSRIQY